jgi:hypothetical protein
VVAQANVEQIDISAGLMATSFVAYPTLDVVGSLSVGGSVGTQQNMRVGAGLLIAGDLQTAALTAQTAVVSGTLSVNGSLFTDEIAAGTLTTQTLSAPTVTPTLGAVSAALCEVAGTLTCAGSLTVHGSITATALSAPLLTSTGSVTAGLLSGPGGSSELAFTSGTIQSTLVVCSIACRVTDVRTAMQR